VTERHHDELFLAIGRLLEHSRGYMLGWAAAIGATVSFIANYMIRAIT